MPITDATVLRIAHRGMPTREPENTLASFALALARGATGIELDLHCTADGVPVVNHDPVTQAGLRIDEVPLAALRSAAGPRVIPTLTEVLELLQGSAWLFAELKGNAIEGRVLAVLARYQGPVAIHSFDHAAIGRIARHRNHPPLGLLSEEEVPDVPGLLARYGATDYWPQQDLVTTELVDTVHGANGRLLPWTVNDEGRMRQFATLGVDGICTDDVALLSDVLGADCNSGA